MENESSISLGGGTIICFYTCAQQVKKSSSKSKELWPKPVLSQLNTGLKLLFKSYHKISQKGKVAKFKIRLCKLGSKVAKLEINFQVWQSCFK